ncbi:MAG TPA: hypothetical protein VLA15_08625 [Desulfurivibrionaceae bacterium]|nr:hypothetical protein [Desulfurivibrionaceae bacterium]
MVGRSLLLVCAVLLLLADGGPVAALEGPLPGLSPGEVERVEQPPLVRVESRLATYGAQLVRWRELGELTANPALAIRRPAEWADCFAAVEHLVRGYGRLQEELRREAGVDGASWSVVFADIAFLEGGCGQVYGQVADLAGVGEPRVVAQAQPQVARPQPVLREQEQLEKLQRAVALFDSGNYDEAIGEFSGLLNTQHAPAAREKIREAQTVVATQLRRQAAGILAKKTDDPAQKKKLLIEAWTLLNKIISSYPEASIIDKVKQNQAQIEAQLDQLDPFLLPSLKGGGPPD